jgi:membrane protease YdiL (CAAX protease family)
MQQIWKVTGPIVLSALSLFLTFIFVQPVACWLDPTFSLFANRGIGKIGITVLVIWHIFLLLFNSDKKLLQDFWQTNFLFFKDIKWVKPFLLYFGAFSALHALFLAGLFVFGYVVYVPHCHPELVSGSIQPIFPFAIKMLLSLIAPFFVAWTEELIFRGTVYKFFVQELSQVTSALLASLIFMLAHNLSNPFMLVSSEWQLGLGLFLLGLFLNLIFILTGKLYTGMGAHAGLVFVKVFLRRVPFLIFLDASQLPFFVNQDLRQSLLFHMFFLVVNVVLILKIHFKHRFVANQIRN